MEGVSFQASIDPRLIGRMRDPAEAQSFIDQQWQRLNARMGRYIAENLYEDSYHLLRIHRDERFLPGPRGDRLLVITLEVGQVTERPFVDVATQSNEIDGLWFDEAINGTTTTVSLEQQRALRDALRREQRRHQGHGVFPQAPLSQTIVDAPPAAGSGVPGGPDEAMWRYIGGSTPPAPKPDPVPHKRHILIDKKGKE